MENLNNQEKIWEVKNSQYTYARTYLSMGSHNGQKTVSSQGQQNKC